MQRENVHILLVEDDEAHAGLICRAFRSQSGVKLTVATSLEEARSCLGTLSPDLVIADLMLPDGKGTEILSSDQSEVRIPVVVMTSFGNEQAAVEAMRAGALDYVVKSEATLAAIPRVVERALREWRQVTERRQAEEALARSEERWRSLVENAPNVIMTVARDGTITFISDTVPVENREQVIGSCIRDYFPAEFRDIVATTIEQVFRTNEPSTFEARVSEEYGSLWFANQVGPVRQDREVVAAIIIATDITEYKRMDTALQDAYHEMEKKVEARTAELAESEAKFRTLFESSNDAVMLLGEEGFFDCNDATLRIYGCSTREEFIGKHPSELSPPVQSDGTDSLTAANARIASAAETGAAHFEWLHRRIDGTPFEADVLLSSMDLKGKTVIQAVVRDISDRKRAEEAILREQSTLRRLLESSDRDRKLTAYEIHDGFTQHVAGARMQLEAASQWQGEDPEAATRAYQRGLELLDQGMGEARRLISGLRPPILDEAGVVAAIEHLVRDPAMQDGPEVGFVFDGQLGRLAPLLENAIFRIVQESVTNACRYSESSKVQIRLTRKNDRIQLEVEDWGIGFDPNDIAKTSFGIGGIRERARLLGGKATVDSAPGKGTRIVVDLPQVCTS